MNVKSNADWVTDVNAFRRWATDNTISGIDYQAGSWLAIQDIYNYIGNHLGLEQKAIEKNINMQHRTHTKQYHT